MPSQVNAPKGSVESQSSGLRQPSRPSMDELVLPPAPSGSQSESSTTIRDASPQFRSAMAHRIVGQLGSSDFALRNGTQASLTAIGTPAYEALQSATNSPDLEVARRASTTLDAIATEAGRDLARQAVLGTPRERRRAVENLTNFTLEAGGTAAGTFVPLADPSRQAFANRVLRNFNQARPEALQQAMISNSSETQEAAQRVLGIAPGMGNRAQWLMHNARGPNEKAMRFAGQQIIGDLLKTHLSQSDPQLVREQLSRIDSRHIWSVATRISQNLPQRDPMRAALLEAVSMGRWSSRLNFLMGADNNPEE